MTTYYYKFADGGQVQLVATAHHAARLPQDGDQIFLDRKGYDVEDITHVRGEDHLFDVFVRLKLAWSHEGAREQLAKFQTLRDAGASRGSGG